MEAVILEKLVRKGVSEEKIFKKKPERNKRSKPCKYYFCNYCEGQEGWYVLRIARTRCTWRGKKEGKGIKGNNTGYKTRSQIMQGLWAMLRTGFYLVNEGKPLEDTEDRNNIM